MHAFTPPVKNNPLSSFMRQPKIYISLPSKGEFWAPGSIEMPENRELPVFSMTARDELLFKTPDALMNGQAVVDVIQSCLPNIKNAWATPTIDLDTILIAIRLATYGEKMPLKHKVPGVNEEVEYELDLKTLLDQQSQNYWLEQVAINENFIICVQPLTLKHMTQANIKSFETTRILSMANDESIPDDKKLEMFNQSFANLTKVTVDLLAESVYKIVTPEAEVTNPVYIKEFFENADKNIFSQVQQHLNKLKEHNNLKPLIFKSSPEHQAAGAPETYEVPVNFNDADFFA